MVMVPIMAAPPVEFCCEKTLVLLEAFLCTVDVNSRKKEALDWDIQNQQRQKPFLPASPGKTQWGLSEASPCLIITGATRTATPWACKRAGACGHGFHHCFWHRLKESRTRRQPLRPVTPFHITSYTYLRKKTGKTHKPDSENKYSLPSKKQNQK